jgi:ubiquinone/menaquinone biosynthesis C-methylase UbiE
MIVSENFEEKYISLRKKENRLYTDEQVRWLPVIDRSHLYYKEWEARKSSSNRLMQHLINRKTELNILEVGCGNGWLCHHLSKIPGSNVAGIDINKTELDQAKRLFDHIENIEFIYGEIDSESVRNERFDAIIFAASIQYFPSLDSIIPSALQLLNKKGEIHILDSQFYRSSELEAARKRSFDYYHSLQFAEMAGYYFHHSIDELGPYDHTILYNPDLFRNRFMKNKNPFPWICIYA